MWVLKRSGLRARIFSFACIEHSNTCYLFVCAVGLLVGTERTKIKCGHIALNCMFYAVKNEQVEHAVYFV